MNKTFIELFAGVGGFRVGLNGVTSFDEDGRAIERGDWNCVFMNQWEPSTKKQHAFDCYVERFGNHGECCNEDISKISKETLPNASLLVGGFPCLTGDSLVLTRRGYVPIVDVAVGDEVVGDDGRWHRVTNWYNQGEKRTYTVEGFGFDAIQATGNHPFYIRTKKKNKGIETMTDAQWLPLEEVKTIVDDDTYMVYMGTPLIQSRNEFPQWEGVDVAVNRSAMKKICRLQMDDDNLWYLVGRYLGDGWLRKNQKKGPKRDPYNGVIICCGPKKKEDFEKKISDAYPYTCVRERTAYKFIFSSVEMAHFFSQFGTYADKKKIPGFVYDLPYSAQNSLLEGYLDSDGDKRENQLTISSINRGLIYGISHIMESVYNVPTGVYQTKKESSTVIEGRTVHQKPLFLARIRLNPTYNTSFIKDDFVWYPVRKITEDKELQTVYDISVDSCHNFVTNHCLVHNCQDYSVARSLKNEMGIEGKKGVLFWDIAEILRIKKIPFVLLENVDRLLISPAAKRGRDFTIILKTLDSLGYDVEYRVLNAADYGMPQKRKRVFLFAFRKDTKYANLTDKQSIFEAFPIEDVMKRHCIDLRVFQSSLDVMNAENEAYKEGYGNAGVMHNGVVTVAFVTPKKEKVVSIGDILETKVDSAFFLNDTQSEKMKYLKGAKRIPRTRSDGTSWIYSEGAMHCPDPWELPGRTMLTSEGTLNRSTHIVEDLESHQWRFLTPIEAERLQMFPDNWTKTEMTQKKRYFMMGNALVTGIIHRLEPSLRRIIENENYNVNE